jgi:hypothetical protein
MLLKEVEKNIWATSLIFKKQLIVNNCPLGENSPNLVTLLKRYLHTYIGRYERCWERTIFLKFSLHYSTKPQRVLLTYVHTFCEEQLCRKTKWTMGALKLAFFVFVNGHLLCKQMFRKKTWEYL